MTVKLLGIETATEACSAALLIDDEIVERFELAPRRHNELILPMCESLLADAGITLKQLDGIGFGCGPGAFTGIRIAASVTQGIALAHDLPVASISTLANLAFQAPINNGEVVMPAIDARMDEIYWALYKKTADNVALIGEERVQLPANAQTMHNISCGLGTGWGTYKKILKQGFNNIDNIIEDALPHAKVTVHLAKHKYHTQQMVEAMYALPVYLRNQVAHQK
ncbi:MAG: tRNA (adenosine(37)-N6)-threonylcarbamoyltransferase complex dimerization subunit type 1 TsaB [Gammaproteobacteria bacterium]|nr:tRNA (adenosine(37)-N6)-threonylcarbamoyltransferase complex dimerization subunit type 1 TsaB [Gammaproteobacteria bacterium]